MMQPRGEWLINNKFDFVEHMKLRGDWVAIPETHSLLGTSKRACIWREQNQYFFFLKILTKHLISFYKYLFLIIEIVKFKKYMVQTKYLIHFKYF